MTASAAGAPALAGPSGESQGSSRVQPAVIMTAGRSLITTRTRANVPLSEYTTIRLGGLARGFIEPEDAAETAAILRSARDSAERCLVLGGGSNLLVADERIDALVIHPVRMNRVEICGSIVTAGAGASLSGLIAKTTDFGLGGLETLAGIPGQVGGAIAMNAGGRYGEIGAVVDSIDVATPEGRIEKLAASDVRFAYRRTELPAGSVVTAATFKLTPGDRPTLKRRAGAILKEKNAAQPTTGWNFGCMFKNPPSQSAGKLVESCGLKGATRGGARISPLHGNFVENLGAATSRDVVELIELAELGVRERHGIELEREVRVWKS